jgi:hypothetical protein
VGSLRYYAPEIPRIASPAEILRKAFASGDSHAKLLSVMLLEADAFRWGGVRQPSVDALKKLCQGMETIGCGNLGRVYWDGEAGAPDDTKAVEAFKKGCDAGDLVACAFLGRVAGDAAATARACSGGFRLACGKT